MTEDPNTAAARVLLVRLRRHEIGQLDDAAPAEMEDAIVRAALVDDVLTTAYGRASMEQVQCILAAVPALDVMHEATTEQIDQLAALLAHEFGAR